MSIEALAKLTNMDLDETLLLLWDKGMTHLTNPKSVIFGAELREVKRILNVPSRGKISSIKYWEEQLGCDEKEIRDKLVGLGFSISENANKLPSGAIRKLKVKIVDAQIVNFPGEKSITELVVEKELEELNVWHIVGHVVDEIHVVSFNEALQVHSCLVEDFKNQDDPIDPSGIRDNTLLDSAITRQSTSIGEALKYPTVEMAGAALLHSLIHNHPFHNGNKRTALVSLLVFLDKNKLMLVCKDEELFQFVLNVAKHKVIVGKYRDLADREVQHISCWIKDNTRPVEIGDRPLTFHKLKQILSRYGCDFRQTGSGMKIIRRISGKGFWNRSKELSSSFVYGGDGRELRKKVIKKIRQDLMLNEQYSIDSAAFYDDSPTPLGEFILRYRKILNRLSRF